jgi:predicted transcriptional regulator
MPAVLEIPRDFARPQTGLEDEPRPGQLDLDPSGLPRSAIEVERRELEKAINRLKNRTLKTDSRLVALGYVMAHLPGVTRSEIAAIVGVSETKLNRWLHGVDQIPQNKMPRLTRVGALLTKLHLVLERSVTHAWLHSTIREISNTPFELIRRGQLSRVEEIVDSYSDVSFG